MFSPLKLNDSRQSGLQSTDSFYNNLKAQKQNSPSQKESCYSAYQYPSQSSIKFLKDPKPPLSGHPFNTSVARNLNQGQQAPFNHSSGFHLQDRASDLQSSRDAFSTNTTDFQFPVFDVFPKNGAMATEVEHVDRLSVSKILPNQSYLSEQQGGTNGESIGIWQSKNSSREHQEGSRSLADFQIKSRPDPFMGAFNYTQQNCDSAFSIDVKVPTLNENQPFSRFFDSGLLPEISHLSLGVLKAHNLKEDEKRQQQKPCNTYELEFVGLQMLDEEQELKRKAKELNYEWKESLDISIVEPSQEVRSREEVFMDVSRIERALDYEEWPRWESGGVEEWAMGGVSTVPCFEAYHSWSREQLEAVERQQMVAENSLRVDDALLCKLVSEMLQGVESTLFSLDYERAEWLLDTKGVRLEHLPVASLAEILRPAMKLASKLERLRLFVSYAKLRAQRKVFSELAKQVSALMITFEEMLLELCDEASRNSHEGSALIVQFLTDVSELSPEIDLLYHLVICEDRIREEELSYPNFDHKFLYSEFEVFHNLLKLSKESDSGEWQYSSTVNSLLESVFQPVLSFVSKLVFQGWVAMSQREEVYLKYYFESTKELAACFGKRMELIREESLDLYRICTQSREICLLHDFEDVAEYEGEWNAIFRSKHSQLQRYLTGCVSAKRLRRRELQRAREREIEELKATLRLRAERERDTRQQRREERDRELAELMRQIRQKEQQRNLEALLIKEKEKGYLLHQELEAKRKLILEKHRLNELIGGEQPQDGLGKDEEQIKPTAKGQASQELVGIEEETSGKEQPNILKVEDSEDVAVTKKWDRRRIKTDLNNHYARVHQQSSNTEEGDGKNLSLEDSGNHQQEPETSPRHTRKKKKIDKRLENNLQKRKRSRVREHRPMKRRELNFEAQELSDGSSERELSQSCGDFEEDSENGAWSAQQQLSSRLPTRSVFEICIDRVVQNQQSVISNSLRILVFEKYSFGRVLEFMRSVFLGGSGDGIKDLLGVSVSDSTSEIQLNHFNDCLLLDAGNESEEVGFLKPMFYQAVNSNRGELLQSVITGQRNYYGNCNILAENVSDFIGFTFVKLPAVLEPFLSYIHLSRYMSIFSWILKFRHCEDLIGSAWKRMNEYKKTLYSRGSARGAAERRKEATLLKLFGTRHAIQAFLSTYQNFLFLKVVEKEYGAFVREKVAGRCLEGLGEAHLRMLDNIVKGGYMQNGGVTAEIRRWLGYVREFANIVQQFCVEDIAEHSEGDVEKRLHFIHLNFHKYQVRFELLSESLH